MKIGIVSCRFGWCEERLREEAEKRGHTMLLVEPRRVPVSAGPHGINIGELSDVDRILFRRTIESSTAIAVIAAAVERLGIPCVERATHYTSIGVSKVGAVIKRSQRIRVPQTWAVWDSQQIQEAAKSVKWPVLIKPDQGSGGRGIVAVADVDMLYDAAEEYFNCDDGKPFVFQEQIPRVREYRVLLLNGIPIATVVKCAADKDVVANANAGVEFAQPEVLGIASEEVEAVEKCAVDAASIHGLLFVGADVLLTPEGTPYILECNRNPQFEATQKACASVNIAAEVIKCIERPEEWIPEPKT